jgi:hypothetical protein
VSGQFTPSSIAVDDVNVYWVNESTVVDGALAPLQILMCAKTGCNNNPRVLFSQTLPPQSYSNQRGFAADGKNVYWEVTPPLIGNSVEFPTGLFACSIGNVPVMTELRQMLAFGDIALNANQAYAIGIEIIGPDGKPAPLNGISGVDAGGPWQVYGCSVNGCNGASDAAANVLWSTPQSATIGSVVGAAVDTSNVYFANTVQRTILACPVTGCTGAPTVVSPDSLLTDAGQLLPWQLGVDQANVYWDLTRYWPNLSGPAEGQVLMCAKAGCNATPTVLASGLRNPAGLASDGVNVYFSERGVAKTASAMDGRISKCAVTGCSNRPVPIADNLSYPQGIALDASHVYWADLGSGATLALPNTDNADRLSSTDGRIMLAPK